MKTPYLKFNTGDVMSVELSKGDPSIVLRGSNDKE